ncbi:DUF1236 domain-containing protein [Peteryoungia ipomoeae]|uniref:DUF1236 domain-containing protein n=1 Tax=Peteryoungia ipomoeae TaxID=1210932 RepID=A0A4S8P5A1_9HYPH|nr:DUF1236 domain-containing protein [Peteryoungia ipomoeae]THV25353.1 DUF1236 domain-containing protein [Peteryoungia ipomoeae]
MRNTLIFASAAAVLTLSASAYAQETVIIQQAPVATHSTVVIPAPARTYVMEREVRSVPYEGDVLVGRVIEDPVELYPIDGYSDYSYTVINEQRVIVDPQTREIVEIIE